MENFLLALFYFFIIVGIAYAIINGLTYIVISSAFSIKNHLIKTDDEKFDEELKQDMYKKYIAIENMQKAYQVKIPTTRMSHSEYLAYLNTPLWKDKGRQRIEIDNWTCQYCGSELQSFDGPNHTPNIHHLHYRNLGNEDIKKDLVSLCKYCHLSLHEKYSLTDMEFHINIERMKNFSANT